MVRRLEELPPGFAGPSYLDDLPLWLTQTLLEALAKHGYRPTANDETEEEA